MDKLWDICEVRKKEASKERQNILDDNWLLDKMGVITNHYISLMNCELVKFQEAVLLLKDYYTSMQQGKGLRCTVCIVHVQCTCTYMYTALIIYFFKNGVKNAIAYACTLQKMYIYMYVQVRVM